MQKQSLKPYEAWFKDHVAAYQGQTDKSRSMVESKVAHTYRVVDHIREIRREAGFSDELGFAMEVGALLHDVGRFPQLVQRGTYDDTGFNHAEESERIVRKAGILDDFSTELKEAVLDAVKLHNLGVLPGTLAPDSRLILEALRDADKLDAIVNILRYLNPNEAHGKALKSGLVWDEHAVTPMILDLAKERKLIAFKSIKWSNDFVLFVCCWLYDLHYNYSYRQLKTSGNFERLLDRMPDRAPFVEVKTQLREDLDWIEIRSRQA